MGWTLLVGANLCIKPTFPGSQDGCSVPAEPLECHPHGHRLVEQVLVSPTASSSVLSPFPYAGSNPVPGGGAISKQPCPPDLSGLAVQPTEEAKVERVKSVGVRLPVSPITRLTRGAERGLVSWYKPHKFSASGFISQNINLLPNGIK